MIRRLSDWLDDRTGYKNLMEIALKEPIRGGARWRYVWGSTLTFTFFIQMVTGIVLAMGYTDDGGDDLFIDDDDSILGDGIDWCWMIEAWFEICGTTGAQSHWRARH